MIDLIPIVDHPALCGQIVSEFAFMKAMARPDDNNFTELQNLSLDDIFNKADNYFIDFTSIEEIIISDECKLSEKIALFLNEWASVTDVVAIQQNIHYNLSKISSPDI